MMNDSDAIQQNEARAVEIEELKRRGLWQETKARPVERKRSPVRYWTAEEVDHAS